MIPMLILLIMLFISLFRTFNWKSYQIEEKKLFWIYLVPVIGVNLLLILAGLLSLQYATDNALIGDARYGETVEPALFVLIVTIVLIAIVSLVILIEARRISKYSYSDPDKLPRRSPLLIFLFLTIFVPLITPLFILSDSTISIDWPGPFFLIVSISFITSALILVINTRSFRKDIISAFEHMRRGNIKDAADQFRDACMYDLSADLYSRLGLFEEAALDHEKEMRWDEARRERSRYLPAQLVGNLDRVTEVDEIRMVRSGKAMLIAGVFLLIALITLGMLFVPGWFRAELNDIYESDLDEVEQYEISYSGESAPIEQSYEYTVHAYDSNGNKVETEYGRIPLTEGHWESDNFNEHSIKGLFRFPYEGLLFTIFFFTFPICGLFMIASVLTSFGRLNGKVSMVLAIIAFLSIFVNLMDLITNSEDTLLIPTLPGEVETDIAESMGIGWPFIIIIMIQIGFLVCAYLMSRIGNVRKQRHLAERFRYSLNIDRSMRMYSKIGMQMTAQEISRSISGPSQMRLTALEV
ncbi:MAG: hypothetical protein ACMUHY_01730 [Thermoplasmatota archaeon]